MIILTTLWVFRKNKIPLCLHCLMEMFFWRIMQTTDFLLISLNSQILKIFSSTPIGIWILDKDNIFISLLFKGQRNTQACERKFKQWWSAMSPISTIRTITYHPNLLIIAKTTTYDVDNSSHVYCFKRNITFSRYLIKY